MRAVLVLVPLALLCLAPAGLGHAAACGEARDAFLAGWDGQFGRDDAQRAVALLESCPGAEPASGSGSTTVGVQGLAASQCSFVGSVSGSHPAAPITAWIHLMGGMSTEHDAGPATVTYDTRSEAAQYVVTGQKWGLTATNQRWATITMDGVPIPVTEETGVSQAAAGCGFPGGARVCWGNGYAMARLPGVGAISVLSEFNHC